MKKITATYIKTVDPTSSEDIASGYNVGQYWRNDTTGDIFYHKTDGIWVSPGGGNLQQTLDNGNTAEDIGLELTSSITANASRLDSDGLQSEDANNTTAVTPIGIENFDTAVTKVNTVDMRRTAAGGATYKYPELPSGNFVKATTLTAQGNTGALTFAGLAANSSTTINIGAVKGFIVDNETTPLTPTFVYVEYAGATGVTVTTLGSGTSTYVLLNNVGAIVFQNTFPTSAQRKTMIWLGKVGHPAGTITTVINEPDFLTSPLQQVRDFMQAFGFINNGVYPTFNGANRNLNIVGGTVTGDGINFVTSPTNPNTLTIASASAITFMPRTQTGAGGVGITLIDRANYDVAGTVTAIGGGSGSSTIQYVYNVPGIGYIVQYGQTVYSTLDLAKAAVGKENYVIFPNLIGNAILIGALAVNKSATDLSNTTQAQFYRADKLGELVSIGGGASITLDSVPTDGSTNGVESNGVYDALYSRGSVGDADTTISAYVTEIVTTSTLTAARTWTLPTSTIAGSELKIIDEFGGISSANNLTIKPPTGKKLNGVTNGTEVISNAYSWRRLLTDGAGNWFTDAGLVRLSMTQTLTNKKIVKRNVQFTYASSVTPNCDTTDIYSVDGSTFLTGSITFNTPTGTPEIGQMMQFRLKDNGSAKSLTFTTGTSAFISTNEFSLPTTTIAGKWMTILFQWNGDTVRWECMSIINSI